MEPLIVEILGRDLSLFHRVNPDSDRIRVGRSPDNDIILGDPTVSPHHIELERTGSGLVVRDLQSENGTSANDEPVNSSREFGVLPVALKLGNARLRVMSGTGEVTPTRLLGCRDHFSCLFESPLAVVSLLLTGLTFSALDTYFSNANPLSGSDFVSPITRTFFTILSAAVVISLFQRISVERWGFGAGIALISIILIMFYVVPGIGHALNYGLTSRIPGIAIEILWYAGALPILVWRMLTQVKHIPAPSVAAIVAITCGLMVLRPAGDLIAEITDRDEPRQASYPQELAVWDLRTKPTLELPEFFRQAAALEGRPIEKNQPPGG